MPKQARIDARVGGEYEFTFYWAAKDATSTAKGKIVQLVPDKVLSYTFHSSNDGPSARPSLLTWTLEGLPGGRTRVTLVHALISGDESGERYSGWGYYLGRLAVHCAKLPVEK